MVIVWCDCETTVSCRVTPFNSRVESATRSVVYRGQSGGIHATSDGRRWLATRSHPCADTSCTCGSSFVRSTWGRPPETSASRIHRHVEWRHCLWSPVLVTIFSLGSGRRKCTFCKMCYLFFIRIVCTLFYKWYLTIKACLCVRLVITLYNVKNKIFCICSFS